MGETPGNPKQGTRAWWRRSDRHASSGWGVYGTGLCLGALLTLVPVAALATGSSPGLLLDPAGGAPGDAFTATVTGFEGCFPADDASPTSVVALAWDGATLGTVAVQGGKGAGTFAVPESQPAGAHDLLAVCTTDSELRATAPYVVDTVLEPVPDEPALPVEPVPVDPLEPVEPAPVEPPVDVEPAGPGDPSVDTAASGQSTTLDDLAPWLLIGLGVLVSAAATVALARTLTRRSRSRAWVSEHVEARPRDVVLRDASMTPDDRAPPDLTIGVRTRVGAGTHTLEERPP